MLILKIALRNLKRHTRKTLLIGVLIILGMAFLFTSNAVFESTNRGLKSSFIRSLTGDAVISAQSDVPYGLFGVEIPIISSYENIPPLAGYAEINERLKEIPEIAEGKWKWTPLVSAAASLEIDSFQLVVPLFGIDPESYFSVCSDIKIERGSPGSLSDGGIFLNARLAENIEAELGRPLEIGEPVTLSMYSDGSFHIRKGIFSGIHSYISYTEPLDRIVLADASIVRGLANYTSGYISVDMDEEIISDAGSFDMDDLFSEPLDTVSAGEEGITINELEEILSDTGQRTALVETDAAAWSFILLSAENGRQRNLLRVIEKEAEENDWAVRVLNWRNAAGLGAQAVFALQTVFYSGMIFIVFGAVLVIMNALVISVFERIPEIGTMRGLGAGRRFISNLFIAESMILTMSASAAGILLGIIISGITLKTGITIENELLITLFGGNVIRPEVSLSGIVKHLVMASVAGSVAWIYPVSLAMRIQPVEIMGKG